MASVQSEPLFVQDDEFDDEDDLQSRRSTMPQQAESAIEIVDVTGDDDDDDIEEIPATQAVAPPQPQAQPQRQQQPEVIDLEREQYHLPIFNKWHYKDEVFPRLRKTYAHIFRRQARLAMPDSKLKQSLEDAAGNIPSRPIAYIIDRDAKAWLQELKEQKKALGSELQTLETFMDEKLRRTEYKRAFRKALLKEAQSKAEKIESDLKLREKVIEEMKIFAKVD